MPDFLAWPRRPSLPNLAAGFQQSGEYRYAVATELRRDDLLEIARMNGFRLSRDLLKRWRRWRFLPGPTEGGPTGKGAGKGQTWSADAGHAVAWLSYWKAARISYDALRLALWPFAPEMDARLADVRASLQRFLRQDEQFQDEVMTNSLLSDSDRSLPAAYQSVLDGEGSRADRRQLLLDAGLSPDDPTFAPQLEFLTDLTFDKVTVTVTLVDEELLLRFITAFRKLQDTPVSRELMETAFLESPLGLARIVVREVHRFRLMQGGGDT
ncbi:MAG: hypothetical protein O3B31_14170 [Chloroflexi bacterium]|nr:hypothetical protein [Chloroflexota bacterium]